MISNELIKKFQVFSKYSGSKIDDIASILNIHIRYVLSDIEKLNDYFLKVNLDTITVQHGMLLAPHISVEDIFNSMKQSCADYIFHEERPYMIVLFIILSADDISLNHLQEFLNVSKNTILLDLRNVRSILYNFNVELKYSRIDGYRLNGNGFKLRQLLEYVLENLFQFEGYEWMIRYVGQHTNLDLNTQMVKEVFSNIEATSRVLSNEKINFLSYLIVCLRERQFEEAVHIEVKNGALNHEYVVQLCTELATQFPQLENEKLFIATRILGNFQGSMLLDIEADVADVMHDFIRIVSSNLAIDFDKTPHFVQNLYNHLVPFYYRLIWDIALINPLKKEVISKYASLFYLVKRSLQPLGEKLNKDISDDEIAYFVIHLGGYLINSSEQRDEVRKITALIVCPHGISSSLLLQAELSQLIPELDFETVVASNDIDDVITQVDVVFSTILLEVTKPFFMVRPMMSTIEKNLLKNTIHSYFNIKSKEWLQVDRLMSIIQKYTIIKDKKLLESALFQYTSSLPTTIKLWGEINLDELLNPEFIQLANEATDWQSAIALAAQPLLDKGYIKQTYIDGMIDSVNKSGPYIVLAPKVAVPHASPSCGVNKLGFSLLRLKQPVSFGNSDEDLNVQLIFVLAAVDSSSHLNALKQLSMILDEEDNIDTLIHMNSAEEIHQAIVAWTKEKEEVE